MTLRLILRMASPWRACDAACAALCAMLQARDGSRSRAGAALEATVGYTGWCGDEAECVRASILHPGGVARESAFS